MSRFVLVLFLDFGAEDLDRCGFFVFCWRIVDGFLYSICVLNFRSVSEIPPRILFVVRFFTVPLRALCHYFEVRWKKVDNGKWVGPTEAEH